MEQEKLIEIQKKHEAELKDLKRELEELKRRVFDKDQLKNDAMTIADKTLAIKSEGAADNKNHSDGRIRRVRGKGAGKSKLAWRERMYAQKNREHWDHGGENLDGGRGRDKDQLKNNAMTIADKTLAIKSEGDADNKTLSDGRIQRVRGKGAGKSKRAWRERRYGQNNRVNWNHGRENLDGGRGTRQEPDLNVTFNLNKNLVTFSGKHFQMYKP